MTIGALAPFYPWIKALHIISVIAWMAGLLYLPRLFVYHSQSKPGSEQAETFKVMERRLLRAIMNPAMGGVYLFGILLLLTPGIVDWSSDGWIYVKLVLVGALTWYHHALGYWRKALAADADRHGPRFYRMMNELPTLIMIGIVVMVVVRPF